MVDVSDFQNLLLPCFGIYKSSGVHLFALRAKKRFFDLDRLDFLGFQIVLFKGLEV
jgi:hypothetical protein